jgi:hypothetical protein
MNETSGRCRSALAAALSVLMVLPAGKAYAEEAARIKAGNQLIVAPGSRLKIAPDGKAARIYRPGGEASVAYSCYCDSIDAPGECSLKPFDDGRGAACEGSCGQCKIRLTIPMKQKFGSRRLEQWPSKVRASTIGFWSRWVAKANGPTTCSSSGYDNR